MTKHIIHSGIIIMFFTCMVTVSCMKSKQADEVPQEESDTILLATNTRPLTDITFESTPERLKRGEYLTNGILSCFVCHSERDSTRAGFPPVAAMKGGGSIVSESATERMVAPNITPDEETGAGTWTDDMFARAIREGIGHDGRALSLPMFWQAYSELSDEDLASVVVYIRSIPAVKNKLPRRKLSMNRERKLQGSSRPLTSVVKEPDLSDMLTRGRYYIKVADCAGCHTGWYKRNPGMFGGGNPIKRNNTVTFSTNITPDPTGLAGWTPEIFINVIRSGKEGTLHGTMPWTSYRNMTDEDLTAILMALQKLPPVNHKVINGLEETLCEVCEQKHGYGKYNKIVPLNSIAVDPASFTDYTGTYVHALGFEVNIKTEQGKLLLSEDGGDYVELVAVAENRFQSLEYLYPISFKRDDSGQVKQMIMYWIEEDILDKKPF